MTSPARLKMLEGGRKQGIVGTREEGFERAVDRADVLVGLLGLVGLLSERVALVLQDPVHALVLPLQSLEQSIELIAPLDALRRELPQPEGSAFHDQPFDLIRIADRGQQLLGRLGVTAPFGHLR